MKILEIAYQNDLLTRLRGGDESAFTALYKAYSKPLYLQLMRMVKDRDLAQEFLQELFLKLWENRENIDFERSFQAFLFTIARNLVYNYFKKVSREQALIDRLLVNATDYSLNGEQLLENKQTGALVKAAIDQLSPQRKLVFNLCKIEGKSYDETSKILAISTSTVNGQITKSMQSIRAYIRKNDDVFLLILIVYFS